jgi:hypothetical protein
MKHSLATTSLLMLLLAGSAGAQEISHVRNLAPDATVSSVDFSKDILRSLSPGERTPLNLMKDDGSSSFIILSSANTPGMNGAFYKTEVSLVTHWTSSRIKVNMYGIPNDTSPLSNPSVIHGGSFTLNGLTNYHWDNILDMLGLKGAGYVLVAVDSSAYSNYTSYLMSATANTYTASPDGGFFRTPIPVFTDGSLLSSTASYRVPNMNQDSLNRHNMVVFNVNATKSLTVNLRFHTYSTTGWSPSIAITVPPIGATQVSYDSLFHSLTGEGELAFNPDSSSSSSGPWVGYAIRTDNTTNDGLLLLPYRADFANWPQ